MSNALTLARPYARAAFAMAREQGQLSQWSTRLAFAAQVVLDPHAHGLLGHPKVGADTLVELLLPPNDDSANFRELLALLAANGRLRLLPEIAALYAELRADAERVVKATVTSATPLDGAGLAKLAAALKKRFGREVELETAVDEALIGGAVIDAGFVVIDGSLRSKLARLESALTH